MGLLKVKRDGPRGFRLIDAAAFNPAVHELFDAHAAPPCDVASLRAQIEALGGTYHHKAGAEKLRAVLADLEG